MKVNKWEVIVDESMQGYHLHQIVNQDSLDILLVGDKVSQDEDKDYYYLKYDNKVIARFSKKKNKFTLIREDLKTEKS